MIRFLSLLLLVCFADAGVNSGADVSSSAGHSIMPNQQQRVKTQPLQNVRVHQTTPPKNACPVGCAHEIELRNHILDVKYQIREERRKMQDVLHNRTSTSSPTPKHQPPKAGIGSCRADCHNVTMQAMILEREKAELETAKSQHRDAIEQMRHKTQPSHQTASARGIEHAQPKNETCPRNCVEAVHALETVQQLRQEIEQAKHAQNPHYTMKTINKTNVQSSGKHCQADCPQVKGILGQVQKFEAELSKIKATPPQVHAQPTSRALIVHPGQNNQVAVGHVPPPSLSSSQISAMTHPKEMCINVGRMLKMISSIEQKIHNSNPHYKPHVAPVNMEQFTGSCSAESPVVMELREVHGTLQLYLTDLEKASHGQSGPAIGHNQPLALPEPKTKPAQSTALVPHTPVTAGTCPKNCHEAWYYLQETYKLRQEIEQAKLAHNPHYTMRTINPPTIQDSGQRCHADCPQVLGIQRQVQKYKAELEQLKTDHAKPAQSTALVPHTPIAAGTCPKNCHEAWYYLQETYKLRQEIEQVKHTHNPHYEMKQITAPTMQDSGQRCHADCPQVLGIQRQVQKYKAELEQLKTDHAKPAQSTALVPHTPVAAGTCPKNCHEAWYYLQETYKLRQEIEQAKLALNPHYTMRTINPPTMQDSGQRCHADCPQVLGIQRQLEKYKAELTAIHSGNALPAPQKGLKGQCKAGCDNETTLRIEIQQLNKKLDQLKRKANPTYRVKTYEPIVATKTGVMCPEGCSNIKQLEARKVQLEQDIAQIQSGHAQPIITEPDDENGALVPYTGGHLDEDVTDQQRKRPGFLSRFKSKVTGAGSRVVGAVRGRFNRGGGQGDNDAGYGSLNQDQGADNDDWSLSQGPIRPSRGGYDPYGTEDDLNYSQGYGYNSNTGNYDPYNQYGNQMSPYGQGYGYNPYGGSSTTHEESGSMYPYPPTNEEIFRNDDNEGERLAAMAAFANFLGGFAEQPAAATAPAAQPPAAAPAPAPQQPVTQQSLAPQDDSDLDALYGGSGNYAPTTGTGSTGYGSSSSYGSYGSGSSNPYSSSYGSSDSSYNSRSNSSSYGSWDDDYNPNNSSSYSSKNYGY